ncbi:MAG: hypothetical protein R3C05_13265 [Pirellulaceae bacterium]
MHRLSSPFTVPTSRELLKCFVACVLAVSACASAMAQGPVPWDFKPYNVLVWIVADDRDAIDMSALIHSLDESFYKSPGAAWSPIVAEPPSDIRTILFRKFESLLYEDITARDYVLAMKRNHLFASSVRSVASAGEKLLQIPGDPAAVEAVKRAAEEIPKSNWQAFLDSLSFDDQGRLTIAGAAQDGSDVVIYFDQTFIARLKSALDENSPRLREANKKHREALASASPTEAERIKKMIAEGEAWAAISDATTLTEEQELVLKIGEQQQVVIPIDVILRPIRAALDQKQSWADFVKQWKIDEDDNLHMLLPGTDIFLPLPNRVFKDFYLKPAQADGSKTPDGAVGLDKKQDFINQQVLIDQLRDMIVVGNGWTRFGTRPVPQSEGVLHLETQWSVGEEEEVLEAARKAKKRLVNNDLMDAMILPRGVALGLQPEAKIIDLKLPSAVAPMIEAPDKVFIVRIRTKEIPMAISVREMDCAMRLMGPIVGASAIDQRTLGDAVARATLRSFSPIVRLENVGKKSAFGRVRAGGLLMIDDAEGNMVLDESNPAAIKEGDLLQPVIRKMDRYGNPELLEIVDFAYLKAKTLNKAMLDMDAYAGRIGTLQGRSDRRTTRNAMKIRPHLQETVVRLHAQREPDVPLIGYDIFSKELESTKMTLVGRTDWDGRLWIKKADDPLKLLYVKNGRNVLAKLPVVPGQSEMEVADIPADDARLRAEAYLMGVENQIIDLVGLRTLLGASIRLKLEKGDLDGARELFSALRDQPSYTLIADDMDHESTVIVSENRNQNAMIRRMFARTREVLRDNISDAMINDLQRDIIAVERGEPMPSKVRAKEAEESQSPPSTQPAGSEKPLAATNATSSNS